MLTNEEDAVAVASATTVVTPTIALPHSHTVLLLQLTPMDGGGQNGHVLFLLVFITVLDAETTNQFLHQAFGQTEDKGLIFGALLDSGKGGVAADSEGAVVGLVLVEESCEEEKYQVRKWLIHSIVKLSESIKTHQKFVPFTYIILMFF